MRGISTTSSSRCRRVCDRAIASLSPSGTPVAQSRAPAAYFPTTSSERLPRCRCARGCSRCCAMAMLDGGPQASVTCCANGPPLKPNSTKNKPRWMLLLRQSGYKLLVLACHCANLLRNTMTPLPFHHEAEGECEVTGRQPEHNG